MQKKLVLVCEDSLCPRKQPDVSGPGLGEAGRYIRAAGERGMTTKITAETDSMLLKMAIGWTDLSPVPRGDLCMRLRRWL